MRSLVKSILKRVVFRDQNPTSFPAVRIATGEVREKFILRNGDAQFDVTTRHCIVCHNPFCIAVWMIDENIKRFDINVEASVVTDEMKHATMTLRVVKRIQEGSGHLVIFEVTSAENFQVGSLRQALMRRYFKNKNTDHEDRCYAAAYSFPRRVIAVSFRDGDYYNIFPMDFQCYIEESNVHIFGLRTTNVTLEKILAGNRVVVGDTDEAEMKTLYGLGSHHSSTPPPMSDLPFAVVESDKFRFPVPEFSAGYREIELKGSLKLGTHMLFYGRVVNSKQRREWRSSKYHIHFFHSFKSNYPKA
jgi:flavin reductase (DIM6/NTAB) family NADH-FMN oxidoreductase RutF